MLKAKSKFAFTSQSFERLRLLMFNVDAWPYGEIQILGSEFGPKMVSKTVLSKVIQMQGKVSANVSPFGG